MRTLATPDRPGVVILGPRRIGKTSILKHLALVIPERTRHQPVYFDPHERAAQPLDEALSALARAIAEALELPEPKPSGDVGAWLSGVWLPSVLRELTPSTSLVLLIDELDAQAHPGEQSAARALHGYLKRLVARHAPRLRLVIALGRDAGDRDGAMFEGLTKCRLSTLSREDTETLIRAPGPPLWSNEAIDAAWALTAGHPLLLQALVANVRAQVSEGATATPADVTAAVEATSSRHRNAFEWIWKGLSPAERAVAAAIAPSGAEGASRQTIDAVLREHGARTILPALAEASDRLVASDLLEPQTHGKYRFRVELLRRLVARYKPPSVIQQDLDLVDPAAEELCRAGEAAQRAGSTSAAKAKYTEALAANPNHARAADQLADVLIARREWPLVNELLDRIQEARPAAARARREQVLRAIAEDAKAPIKPENKPIVAAPPAASPSPARAQPASPSRESAEKASLTKALEAEKQARESAEARVTMLAAERDRLLERLRAEHQPSIVVGADPAILTKSLEAEKQARAKAEVRVGLLTAERDRLRATLEARQGECERLESALQTMTLERDQLAAELDARDRPSSVTRLPSTSGPEPAPPPMASWKPPPMPVFIEEKIALPEPIPAPPAEARRPQSTAPPPRAPTDAAVVIAKPKPAPRGRWSRLAAPLFAITGVIAIAAASMQTRRIELDAAAITIVDASQPRRVSAAKVLRIGKRRPAADVAWTSADPRVAKVDERGNITAVASGKTRIEARVGAMAAAVDVVVNLAARIELEPSALTLTPSSPEATLKARLLDASGALWANGAEAPEIAWASSAPSVASVAAGKVKREGPGEAVIEARFGALSAKVAIHSVDDARAAALGCDAGKLDACVALAKQADTPPERAMEWLDKACNGGSMKGCVELGAAHEDGKSGKPNPAKAVALFQKACDGDEPSGCSRLGAMLETGTGTLPNIGRARELHKAACERGDGYGCWHLGAIYELGNGVARDAIAAAGAYEKACDKAQWAACSSLANMYWNGSGKVQKDVPKGLALYEKACDAKHEPACTVLALNYKAGDGVPLDRAKSYAFFWKACDAGSRAACVIAPRPPSP